MKKRLAKDRFFEKVRKTDNCWIWTGGKYYNGYGQFFQNPNKIVAHRFSYILHYGEISKDLMVCHKCDNRECVNPHHLFLGTQSDNIKDMVNKGRQVKTSRVGEINGNSKINEKTVKEIRRLYRETDMGARLIGLKFGLSETQTFRVIKGESWKNIDK